MSRDSKEIILQHHQDAVPVIYDPPAHGVPTATVGDFLALADELARMLAARSISESMPIYASEIGTGRLMRILATANGRQMVLRMPSADALELRLVPDGP